MKLSVSIITCKHCGRVLECSIPRVTNLGNPDPDDNEIESGPNLCSPAFAQSAGCPDHPPLAPRRGLSYAPGEAPLVWSTKIVEAPAAVGRAVALRDRLRALVDSWGNGRVHAGVDRMIPSSELRTLLEEANA